VETDEVKACNLEGTCVSDTGMNLCGGSGLPNVDEDLILQGGCADILLWAANEDSSLGLFFEIDDGLVLSSAADTTDYYDLQVDGFPVVNLEIRVGAGLLSGACTDVFTEPPVVDETWVAVSGELLLTLEGTGEDGPFPTAYATLDLTDVVFVSSTSGEEALLPGYLWSDIYVGWLPG
jgi:hypothetical protein